jgi:hypothetical protein
LAAHLLDRAVLAADEVTDRTAVLPIGQDALGDAFGLVFQRVVA